MNKISMKSVYRWFRKERDFILIELNPISILFIEALKKLSKEEMDRLITAIKELITGWLKL
jgi:hypothetical protein